MSNISLPRHDLLIVQREQKRIDEISPKLPLRALKLDQLKQLWDDWARSLSMVDVDSWIRRYVEEVVE